MNGLQKTVTNLIQMNLASKDHYCPHCKELVPKLELEILGQRKVVQPKCPCEVKAEEEKLQRLVDAGEKREVEKRFALSSLGDRFKDSTFHNFEMRLGSEKSFQMAYQYAQEFNEWGSDSLLIWGDYGNGKSHLAAAIANELNERGKIVIFQSVPELLERIRSTFNKNSRESENEILTALQMCHLLILDDIGAEKVTDWVQEALFRIIDKRYRKKKPILYTSNLKPSMLSDKLGGRIYDRITETSLTIENKASSYRRQKAAERFKKYQESE
jgi:DNA replication protein DnaC